MNHVVCDIAISLERMSLFVRSLMSSSLILRNFQSSLSLSLVLVYCSIVRTGLQRSTWPSFSTEGSTVLIPPITTRWPCAIVHLFDTFRHHTHAIDLHFSPGVPRINLPWIVCLNQVSQPSSEPFSVPDLPSSKPLPDRPSQYKFWSYDRPNHHLHPSPQYPDGGTFGWTDTQAQIIVVERQLHTILYNDLLTGHASSVPGSALPERASAPCWKSERMSMTYCNDMVQ